MKNSILLLFALLISLSVKAQSDDDYFEIFRSTFGKDKKTIVTELIPLEEITNASFNEVYDAYEAEQQLLAKERYKLLESYIENYYDIDDEKADELMKQALSIKKKETKIMTKYHKQMSKKCGGKIAAQFYQIENYFSNAIMLTITENLPFVGELE
ncbi:MAG: hypothetical protein R8N23_00600 [Reichenbachiella sp.]|uniref:hypothetical protein n=1 Tax=Reichenbachiella sp. TaxID=2184521 RepID=UPI0029670867|nr:hypothetical protein [Reichenbachiella sp.]MDW3208333.1 hypothetical protein [Reichenbachiella sp.]